MINWSQKIDVNGKLCFFSQGTTVLCNKHNAMDINCENADM